MKTRILSLLLAGTALLARAHDHLEIRQVPGVPTQLGIIVTATNVNPIGTYFPLGQAPSFDLFAFPGGTYATELTFGAFDSTSATLGSVFVRAEILDVDGPSGATFSFWEAGATAPTITRATGWTSTVLDTPSFAVSEDNTGYGHIHGRAFTATRPGTYDVTFRVIDTLGHYTASAPFVVHFTVLDPPQLSISKVSTSMKLSFTGRPNLIYDLQSTTNLQANDWTTIATLDGTGALLESLDPIASRPRAFYRIVEYQ